MSDKDLIEKLKFNKIAFGLLTPEEQECLLKIGNFNCLMYTEKKWCEANAFDADFTYTIKPDYQPDPEYVDLEIKESNYRLVVFIDTRIKELISEFTCISLLPSLPNFKCFQDEGGGMLMFDDVSTRISEGRKVYARLRR